MPCRGGREHSLDPSSRGPPRPPRATHPRASVCAKRVARPWTPRGWTAQVGSRAARVSEDPRASESLAVRRPESPGPATPLRMAPKWGSAHQPTRGRTPVRPLPLRPHSCRVPALDEPRRRRSARRSAPSIALAPSYWRPRSPRQHRWPRNCLPPPQPTTLPPRPAMGNPQGHATAAAREPQAKLVSSTRAPARERARPTDATSPSLPMERRGYPQSNESVPRGQAPGSSQTPSNVLGQRSAPSNNSRRRLVELGAGRTTK